MQADNNGYQKSARKVRLNPTMAPAIWLSACAEAAFFVMIYRDEDTNKILVKDQQESIQ